jgi:glycosyltransferase involved in cell wall biosynthesis
MKIAFLVDSLELGGAERMAVSIVNSLSGQLNDLSLFVMRQDGPLRNRILPNVDLVVLRKLKTLDLKAFIFFRRCIRKGKFDIVHAHSSTVIWAILVKLSGIKVKVVWHDHYGGNELNSGIFRNLVKLFSNNIDYIISVNNNLRQWAQVNFPKTKVVCLNNFTDLTRITTERNNQVLLLANFRPQKDHACFLDAMSILKEQYNLKPTFCLIGSFVDISYVGEIKKMILKLNLTDQCVFFGPTETPEKFLFSSKIGVLSSISEGLPVSLLEYGLAGLIPVATRVGDCERVIGNNGYLVDSKNSNQLAEAIYKAMVSPEANQKAVCFKQNIQNEFGPNGFIEKYLNFIKE